MSKGCRTSSRERRKRITHLFCHVGGTLILCDHCPSSFHLECIQMEVCSAVTLYENIPHIFWLNKTTFTIIHIVLHGTVLQAVYFYNSLILVVALFFHEGTVMCCLLLHDILRFSVYIFVCQFWNGLFILILFYCESGGL